MTHFHADWSRDMDSLAKQKIVMTVRFTPDKIPIDLAEWHELLGNEAQTIARLIREGKIPNEETINFKCFTDF